MMKKKFLGLALLAVSLASFNSFAQTSRQGTCPVAQDQTCTQTCDNNGRPSKACPFEGLNLTDTQKSQIKELQDKQKSARTERAKADKDAKASRKAERCAQKKQYLQDVKAILTPDQYVLFLENMVVNNDGPRKDKALMHKADRKHDKDKASARKSERKGEKTGTRS